MLIEIFNLGKVQAGNAVEFEYTLVDNPKNIELSCTCLSTEIYENKLKIKWTPKKKGKNYISSRYVIITYSDNIKIKIQLKIDVYE